MTKRLEGKVAIVTGAAGGIGMASAARLAQDGLVEIQLVEASVLELTLGYGARCTREDLR